MITFLITYFETIPQSLSFAGSIAVRTGIEHSPQRLQPLIYQAKTHFNH
jgi:hypothetical protein